MKKKMKIRLTTASSLTMFILGAIALIISILYTSTVLAFIGLSLAFWGALLLYVQDQDYTRTVLLDASTLPQLETLDQTLQELDYNGNAVYLPPRYFETPEKTKIYLPKQKDARLPKPEQIQKYENQMFIKNPQGILLTPPGSGLTELFEKTLGKSFTKVDVKYLQQNLPKLFIEDLEIAENLEIEIQDIKSDPTTTYPPLKTQTKNETIKAEITNSVFTETCKEAGKMPRICGTIGHPLLSAIACAIAKASGKPVTIERIQSSEDGRTTQAYYRIIEE